MRETGPIREDERAEGQLDISYEEADLGKGQPAVEDSEHREIACFLS